MKLLRRLFLLLIPACAAPPEIRRETVVQIAPAPPVQKAQQQQPSQVIAYGSIVVIFKTIDGEEHTLICGGEVSSTRNSP